jgi:hypothetical protein
MIELVGYTMGEAKPGEPVSLTLIWRAVEPPSVDLTTFVHLLGPEEADWGQEDREPGLASFPTSRWRSGDIVVDRFEPVLSPEARGPLTVRVGWYDRASGERLNVGGATEMNLRPVEVAP